MSLEGGSVFFLADVPEFDGGVVAAAGEGGGLFWEYSEAVD